jgi:hypothetical protein
VLPRLGDRTLASLRTEDVDRLIAELEADGKAPGTVRNVIVPLRKMLADAVRQGLLIVNPAARADLPPAQDFAGKEIPVEHTEAMRQMLVELAPLDPLRSGPDLFFVCLFDVALGTGLRLGELRALRWRDVDRERRLIRVERAYSRQEVLFADPRRTSAPPGRYRTGRKPRCSWVNSTVTSTRETAADSSSGMLVTDLQPALSFVKDKLVEVVGANPFGVLDLPVVDGSDRQHSAEKRNFGSLLTAAPITVDDLLSSRVLVEWDREDAALLVVFDLLGVEPLVVDQPPRKIEEAGILDADPSANRHG